MGMNLNQDVFPNGFERRFDKVEQDIAVIKANMDLTIKLAIPIGVSIISVLLGIVIGKLI